jgi:hypothetical protein
LLHETLYIILIFFLKPDLEVCLDLTIRIWTARRDNPRSILPRLNWTTEIVKETNEPITIPIFTLIKGINKYKNLPPGGTANHKLLEMNFELNWMLF